MTALIDIALTFVVVGLVLAVVIRRSASGSRRRFAWSGERATMWGGDGGNGCGAGDGGCGDGGGGD